MTRVKPLVPNLPRRAWVILGGDFVSAVGSGLTLPFLIVYLHRVRHLDLEISGLAVSTVALAALVGNPVSGVIIDRMGSRLTLVLGLLLAGAGSAWLAFVDTPPEALAAAWTTGLGLALVWPAIDSLLAVAVRPEQRSSVFAVRHATMNAGFGLGALLAALIVEVDSVRSFQILYLVDAASFVAFAPLLLALRTVGGRPEPDHRAEGGYREVLGDRVFLRVVGLTVLLCFVGYAQLLSAFPAFATDEIGPGALGIAFAVNTIAVSALQLPVLRLAEGRRRTAALVGVFALFALTWGLTLAAGELGNGASAVAAFSLAAGIFAVGETLMAPSVAPIVNDLAPEPLRGRYNGINTLAWTTGYILGPLAAGVALSAGRATLFFLALVAACGLGAIAAVRLRSHLPPQADLIGATADG